jgi:hypothetical protein
MQKHYKVEKSSHDFNTQGQSLLVVVFSSGPFST